MVRGKINSIRAMIINAVVYFWDGFYWIGYELDTFSFLFVSWRKWEFGEEKIQLSGRHSSHVGSDNDGIFTVFGKKTKWEMNIYADRGKLRRCWGSRGKSVIFDVRKTYLWILVLPVVSCMITGKLLICKTGEVYLSSQGGYEVQRASA